MQLLQLHVFAAILGVVLCDLTPCPSGWTFISRLNKCVLLENSQAATFGRARNICQNAVGGDLASIHSDDDYAALLQVGSGEQLFLVWLGLNRSSGSTNFSWVDGSPLNYTRWLSGEPGFGTGDCAGWKTTGNADGWRTVDCSSEQPWLCVQTSASCPTDVQSGMNGTIQSSNWPSDYDNNLICYYHLTAPKGFRVDLTFDFFQTERAYDFVRIYDVPNPTGNCSASDYDCLGQLSGNLVSMPRFTSVMEELTVVFTTDSTVTYSGFHATWTAIAQAPAINVSGANGFLESDGYPGMYADGTDQIYHISQPAGLHVQLLVNDVDLQPDRDNLAIFDGPDVYSPLLARLVGTLSGPQLLKSTSNVMTFRFYSDDVHPTDRVYRGWHVKYQAGISVVES